MRPISFKQRVDEIFIEKLQQLSREMIISSPIGGSELANRETMNEKGKMKKRGREKTKTGVSNKRFNQIFIGGKLGNFQPNDNFSFVRQIREINKTEEIKNRAKRERERDVKVSNVSFKPRKPRLFSSIISPSVNRSKQIAESRNK